MWFQLAKIILFLKKEKCVRGKVKAYTNERNANLLAIAQREKPKFETAALAQSGKGKAESGKA